MPHALPDSSCSSTRRPHRLASGPAVQAGHAGTILPDGRVVYRLVRRPVSKMDVAGAQLRHRGDASLLQVKAGILNAEAGSEGSPVSSLRLPGGPVAGPTHVRAATVKACTYRTWPGISRLGEGQAHSRLRCYSGKGISHSAGWRLGRRAQRRPRTHDQWGIIRTESAIFRVILTPAAESAAEQEPSRFVRHGKARVRNGTSVWTHTSSSPRRLP